MSFTRVCEFSIFESPRSLAGVAARAQLYLSPRQDDTFRLSFLWPEYASGEGIIYAATCVFGGGSGSLSRIALFTSISSTSCPCWTASA